MEVILKGDVYWKKYNVKSGKTKCLILIMVKIPETIFVIQKSIR